MDPTKSKGYMGGGGKLKSYDGKLVTAPNLTFHTTGIGNWSEDDFKRAIKEGIGTDNNIITFPMPTFNDLSDHEISAIYAYLKTVPEIDHRIKK